MSVDRAHAAACGEAGIGGERQILELPVLPIGLTAMPIPIVIAPTAHSPDRYGALWEARDRANALELLC